MDNPTITPTKFKYHIVLNRCALPNRHPPPFLDVKQSIKMYLRSDAKMQHSRRYNYSKDVTQTNAIQK